MLNDKDLYIFTTIGEVKIYDVKSLNILNPIKTYIFDISYSSF